MKPTHREFDEHEAALRELIESPNPMPPLSPDGSLCLLYAGITAGESIATMVKAISPPDALLYLTAVGGSLRDELSKGWEGSEEARQCYVDALAELLCATLTHEPFDDTAAQVRHRKH